MIAKESQEQIWHCPSEADRELAALLVGFINSEVWQQIANHLNKPYPFTLADKFDLVYRMLGCKK